MPSAETADDIYDAIAAKLATPEFRPRALYDRFGIEFLATTDDPCDDLAAHAKLASDPTWTGQVAPTFRPDKYLEPAQADWNQAIDRLGEVSGVDTGDLRRLGRGDGEPARLLQAARGGLDRSLARRRPGRTDHGRRGRAALRPGPERSDHAGRGGHAAPQLHVRAGQDGRRRRSGDDPAPGGPPQPPHAHVRGLRRRCGLRHSHGGRVHQGVAAAAGGLRHVPVLPARGFHHGRDGLLARTRPARGLLPFVYVGVPWWFVDAPEAMARFRGAVTESAGFTRTSGFIDDTRAYCPSPHGTTCAAGSTRATWPSWSPSIGWTMTKPSKSRASSWSPTRAGRSSSEHLSRDDPRRPPPPVAGAAGHPARRTGAHRASRARQLPPGPPGLVHRPRRRRRRLGHRGLHRAPARRGGCARPSGRPVHPDHPRVRR